MKALDVITLILIIIGGLNWGLIGLFQLDVVTTIFGDGVITQIIYILVGLAALWQLIPLSRSMSSST
jgi:uncharacterized membrane protein YuzA (DUF378 family)